MTKRCLSTRDGRWSVAALVAAAIAVGLLCLALWPEAPDGNGSAAFVAMQAKPAPALRPRLQPPRLPSPGEAALVAMERNRENAARLEAFAEDGWEEVEVDDPPDEELAQLSLSLLGNREGELQQQIQSNSFADTLFPQLAAIAVETRDDKTRYVALEALGRSNEREAQQLLMKIFDRIDDDEARSQILGALVPSEPGDETARFLRAQLADPSLPDRLKMQASFPLAMAALLNAEDADDAMEIAAAELPEAWRGTLAEIVNLVAEGGQTDAR